MKDVDWRKDSLEQPILEQMNHDDLVQMLNRGIDQIDEGLLYDVAETFEDLKAVIKE